MLRFLTAGESHGRALVVIVEGLPAGLAGDRREIQRELARRRLGFGRGPRMRFEADEVTLLGGIRHGRTLGSPGGHRDRQHRVAQVGGGDVARPGAAHQGPDPAPARARRSGRHAEVRVRRRPRRARAGLGPRDRGPGGGRLPGQGAAGPARDRRAQPRRGARRRAGRAGTRPAAGRPRPVDASPVRCFDPEAEARMVAAIKAAAKDGDSLGGVVEVLAYGVPVGLGSHVHWDRRLDGLLAQALMSIQAVKDVEIGEGAELAGRADRRPTTPSLARDDADGVRELGGGYVRDTHRAGGIEGGMSTGGPIVARASMKPLATLNRPVARDRRRGHQGGDGLVQGAHRRHGGAGHGRGGRDHGGPRAGRRGAAQVRGRLVEEFRATSDGYLAALGETPSAAPPAVDG